MHNRSVGWLAELGSMCLLEYPLARQEDEVVKTPGSLMSDPSYGLSLNVSHPLSCLLRLLPCSLPR